MPWHGWFDADPFWVYLDADGSVQVHLGDVVVHRSRLHPTTNANETTATQPATSILLLPGNDRLPPFASRSWVNARGRGQLVLPGHQVFHCRMNGRARSSPFAAKKSSAHGGRHPKAGLWLALAADLAGDFDLRLLQLLTGYSYPSVRTWVRHAVMLGQIWVGFAGRTQLYTTQSQGRIAWWKETMDWWPQWRHPRWPQLHGPATVQWAKWSTRLPEHVIGQETTAPLAADPATWVWATGADHVAALGRLIQPFDSDVWMSRSAWEARRGEARILSAPRDERAWPGTRVSVMADGHPLVRLLCARAGVRHPAWLAEAPPLPSVQARPALLDGLPLLDAISSHDARVAEQGQAALANLTAKALAP